MSKRKLTLSLILLFAAFGIVILGLKRSEPGKENQIDQTQANQVTTQIKPNLINYFNLNTIAPDQISSLDDFKSGLELIEKNIWIEIKEVYNLTKEEFLQRRNELYEEYRTSIHNMSKRYSEGLKDLEQSTVECIHSIMKECNVDLSQLQLIPWNVSLPASATDLVIFVNESMFNALTYETKKFIIGHELTHVINKDHSTRWTIRNTEPIKSVYDNENSPLNKLSKFHELRADIMCSIKSDEYSKGAIQFMQDQTRKYGELHESQRVSYPTNAMREAINTKILDLHKATNKVIA